MKGRGLPRVKAFQQHFFCQRATWRGEAYRASLDLHQRALRQVIRLLEPLFVGCPDMPFVTGF
jgi:hypothetical protein